MTTMRLACIVVVFVLAGLQSASTLSAEPMNPAAMPHYGQWRSSMIGGGGYIQNVAFTANPRVLYAYVDVGGFYRSDDGGKTWRMMHGHLPNMEGRNEIRGLLVDPRDADRILVACGNQSAPVMGIFLSTDGGRTLQQTLKARFAGNEEHRIEGFILARDPANADSILAGSIGEGIYRSMDGGKTWALAGENTRGFDFTDIRFDRADSSRAYACALKLDNTLGSKPANLAGGFFISADSGATWKKLSDGSPGEIVQDSLLPRLYGTFDGGWSVRASDDGGVTWREFMSGLQIDRQKKPTGLPSPARYNALAAGPDFVIISSHPGDLYVLKSGQTAWQPVHRESVDYRGWTIATRPDIQPMFGQGVSSISVDPRNPNHWFLTDSFAIFESIDAGKNWAVAMDGVEATVVHTLCQDPADPGLVHLGMADCGYFTSADGGVSFQASFVCSNVKDVAVSPKLPARVYALGTGEWEWASNQVFVSIDAGKTWSRSPMIGLPDMKKARCNTIAVNPDDPYECFLAVSGAIAPSGGGPYRSADGGRSWKWLGEGLPQGKWFFPESIWIPGRQLATGPDGEVACVGNGALYSLDRSTMQWKQLASSGNLSSVIADPREPGAWLISSDSGIYRIAGGKIDRVYDKRTTHLSADMVVKGRMAAACNDGILLSTDSGKTWTMLDEELPQKLAYNALAFAGDRLIVGSGGSGGFWIPLFKAAANPVKASPVTPVPARPAPASPPVINNLDFAEGTDFPTGWNRPWVGQGKISAARDTTVLLNGKPTLHIQSDAPDSTGSVGHDFVAVPDEFVVTGVVRAEGQIEAAIAVQVFDAAGKQIAWLPIASLKRPGDQIPFASKATLPAGAARGVLVLFLHGDGKAWFGELKVTSSPPVFP